MPENPSPALPAEILDLSASGAISIIENAPLAKEVSMGVGGPARWLLTVEKDEALEPALGALRLAGIPWMILGGGSNTFFADSGYPGAVVKLGKAFRSIAAGPGEHRLTAGAGAVLSAVMNASKRAGLTGLEWAAGVPGALGGALAGNAGTAYGDACSALESVDVLEVLEGGAAGFASAKAGESGLLFRRRRLFQGDFAFSYRRSSLREFVILSATYALKPGDPEEIQKRIDAGLAKRREQPLGQRSSGCMFKNPPGDAAGRLIDTAGLKGLAVGGAKVSQEHANFIVNDGQASAADIMGLATEVQRRVREKWGVELELEIRMVSLDSPFKIA